jgi:hypothetical protein
MRRLFDIAAVRTNAAPDDAVFQTIKTAYTSTVERKSAQQEPRMWRFVMKSPLTKLAVAAALIFACAIGLSLWRTTGSGIALADVLARIEQVAGYTYQVSSTVTRHQTTSKYTSTIIVSKEDGIKMTVTTADSNSVTNKAPMYRHAVGDESFLLPRVNSLISISHREKTYTRLIYDGVKLEFYKEQYNDPHTLVKQMLNCKHTSLGQSVIDGVTVEGFQIADIAYGGGFFGEGDTLGEPEKVDVKLWADVNTFLPIGLEEDIVTKAGARIHEVCYDFRWNVIVTPDDFKPNIPEDYRAPAGDIIIRPFDEENAIKGLKLFADLVGKYPASVEIQALFGQYKKHTGSDPNAYRELSDEERTRRTSEGLSIAAPAVFYKTLVESKTDPAYYGKTVTPRDTDKVLMRWKLSDNEYRVIFGDLHAETVSPEKLAELEQAMPK